MSNNQHTKSIIRKVIDDLSRQCRWGKFSLEHNGALGCLTIRTGVVREQRMKLLAGLAVAFTLTSHPVASQITTSQYDNMRTGATLHEKILTPANVNVRQFGKLGVFKVDGAVYAQPLFVPGVEIPGKGTHNVLYVATEHDSVYAFDAERPGDPPLWHVNFLDEARNITSVSADLVQCPFIEPEVGITSTPVIDIPSGTIYVLARTQVRRRFSDDEFFQHLHALAITTGVEKFGGPKALTASVLGRGRGSKNGRLDFNPLLENPRASLLLTNNALYLTWASSCDVGSYHGWVMAYDPETLAQKAALNVTPDGGEGGIWASDTGPAADIEGNVYVPTGNGTFDAATGGHDYGDSELKLVLQGSAITVRDYFTPSNQAQLNESDGDLGSSGPTLLPDQPGPHRHLLLQPTKANVLYVIDRDRMGEYRADGDRVVQRIRMAGGGYGAIAYWNEHVFFACEDDFLRDYALKNGQMILNTYSHTRFSNPGATPTISANGKENAIVWAVATRVWNGADRPAVLYAFNAKDVTQPIYNSEQNRTRDRAGLATRFVVPIVLNGRVYVATRGEIDVYGLFH